MPRDEREDLVEHISRCRDLLALMKKPAHRATIVALLAYLESKLAAMK